MCVCVSESQVHADKTSTQNPDKTTSDVMSQGMGPNPTAKQTMKVSKAMREIVLKSDGR